ncbi:MAG: DUF3144 domain-containing protein [Chromatocurvus sp.]
MAEDKNAQHQACMERFIALANSMKDEGIGTDVISWALMTASGVHATYSVAGNEGGLTESGIDKVADAYRKNLANIQALKKQQSAGTA